MTNKPIERMSFLVVDDQAFVRDIVKDYLTQMGARLIHEADDGQTAIDILEVQGGAIDCIISDFKMPRLTGLELLQAVRADRTSAPRDVPFIMLTMYADRLVLGLAMAFEVDHFVAKPVSRAQLEARVASVAERARPELRPAAEYARISVREALGPALSDLDDQTAVSAIPTVEETLRSLTVAATDDADTTKSDTVAVSLDAIPVNAVLARDLALPSGALLVPAGTRLTERVIDRLADVGELYSEMGVIYVNT
jgi:two-component system, chemotaxis family, chemotaxis protein CheY